MAEKHTTFCRICESLCGLVVEVEGGRVVKVRADDDHVATRGFSCPKGLRQHEIYASPDRLLAPEKRTGDRWEKIDWDRALREIGTKVRQLRADHGPDSIAMYVGTAAGFGVLHPVFAQGFLTGIGSRSMYSSSTQDCANKFAVAREVYGFPFTQPFPDLERIRCLVIVGANPVISKWSFLQVPNPARALQAIEARGGRIFVVDPRRTETARAAGEHVFIRPDTDVFFYLSFLRELLAGGVDEARVGRFAKGIEAIRELCAPWTPERTAEVTRIPPAKLREMVEAFRTADGAALYSSTGVNMGSQRIAGLLAPGGRELRLREPRPAGRDPGRERGHRLRRLRQEDRHADAERPLPGRRFPVGERWVPGGDSSPTRSSPPATSRSGPSSSPAGTRSSPWPTPGGSDRPSRSSSCSSRSTSSRTRPGRSPITCCPAPRRSSAPISPSSFPSCWGCRSAPTSRPPRRCCRHPETCATRRPSTSTCAGRAGCRSSAPGSPRGSSRR